LSDHEQVYFDNISVWRERGPVGSLPVGRATRPGQTVRRRPRRSMVKVWP